MGEVGGRAGGAHDDGSMVERRVEQRGRGGGAEGVGVCWRATLEGGRLVSGTLGSQDGEVPVAGGGAMAEVSEPQNAVIAEELDGDRFCHLPRV